MTSRKTNVDKFTAALTARGITLAALAQRVGSSTLYAALFLPRSPRNEENLRRICLALRCHLDEVSDPAPAASGPFQGRSLSQECYS